MKGIVKYIINLFCRLLVSPLAVPIRLLSPIDQNDHWFQFGSHLVSLLPGLPGDYIRRAYYYWVVGAGTVSIGFGTTFAQRDTTVRDGAYIGSFCNIGSATIEEEVLIGSQVMIACPRMHFFDRTDTPIRHQGGQLNKIRIGAGAWVGNGAIVLEDVAEGVVIAAGAVVTKPCERNGIYAGNPARLVRRRGEETGSLSTTM